MKLQVLYEDECMLAVEKPVGVESQSARAFEPDMVSEVKKYLTASQIKNQLSTQMSTKLPQPYVGVIHRLDKPVSGVMVYAKTQKAAAALSKQVQDHKMEKVYRAVICGKPVDNSGVYVDYLWKDGKNNMSRIVDNTHPDARQAELSYQVLKTIEVEGETLSLVEILLKTGRHHQIRVQFAGRGLPLWGDQKYNPGCPSGRRTDVALAACSLTCNHPVSGKRMTFTMEPKGELFKKF